MTQVQDVTGEFIVKSGAAYQESIGAGATGSKTASYPNVAGWRGTLLAIESARLGRETGDTELLDLGQQAAERVIALAGSLPGHPPWRVKANAALTHVRRARPDPRVETRG
jgi:hypothetical protein